VRRAARRPVVHAFADTARFGRALARELGADCRLLELHRFPDGESLVRARGAPARRALVVRSLHDPNARLLETLLAADALARSGCERVELVAPYLPYMRQDAVFRPGEPLSQRVVGRLLGRAFDAVYAVEPHLHRVRTLRGAIGAAGVAIPAAPAIAAWIARGRVRPLVIGPDVESRPWVESIASRAGLPFAVGEKVRLGDRRVRVRFGPLPPAPRAVVVDDIASSVATLAATARALRARGVARVDVVVVHALFARGALDGLKRAGVERVVSCDSIAHATNSIRLAPLVARAVQEA
jgi:ribose-phosphate pyrophosphokinase